jgi:transposase
LETQIEHLIAADDALAQTTQTLRSGSSPITSSMLIAEMPKLGQITFEQAETLTGLAPITHDSGAMRGKRDINGGRGPDIQEAGLERSLQPSRRPNRVLGKRAAILHALPVA